jgi:branched-chain amino acid transport system substrate-binding protein
MLKNCFFILFFFFSFLSFAQAPGQVGVNEDFNQAISEYNAGNYDLAFSMFQKITNSSFNSKTTIAYLFSGKTEVQLNQFHAADSILTSFLQRFPNSNYADEARLTLAKSYFEEKNYEKAFVTLVNLVESSDSNFYVQYGKETAEKIAYNHLSSFNVEGYFGSDTNPKIRPFILLIESELEIRESDIPNAKKYLTSIIQNFPQSTERTKADSIFSKIKSENLTSSTEIIGVLLPLSGTNVPQSAITASNEILEGIKYAVDQFNKSRNSDKIGLIIRDTEFDQKKIDEIKNEFASNQSIKVILGPIYSNEVRIAIEDFKDIKIPIVSPTATDNDLTSLSPYFFQANPPFSFRGKIMANYVYYVLNLRRLGVFNARQGYSPVLATNFISEFQDDGGQIMADSTYQSNYFNLQNSFAPIAAFRDTLQGLYLPLSDKIDAPAVLSQLVQDSLNIPIFGNQDWLYAKGLESYSDISNKLLFTSDNFIDYSSEDFIDFSKDFEQKTKMQTNPDVLYGYDTAKYLLTVLRNSGVSRDAVLRGMEAGIMSIGFHNNIAFDKNHINNYMNILRYDNGKFELVDRFKLKTNDQAK